MFNNEELRSERSLAAVWSKPWLEAGLTFKVLSDRFCIIFSLNFSQFGIVPILHSYVYIRYFLYISSYFLSFESVLVPDGAVISMGTLQVCKLQEQLEATIQKLEESKQLLKTNENGTFIPFNFSLKLYNDLATTENEWEATLLLCLFAFFFCF